MTLFLLIFLVAQISRGCGGWPPLAIFAPQAQHVTMKSHLLFPILRLMRADGLRFGTGKAQLLQNIHTHGSIAQAGQAMGMSYKRAWSLIHEMNQMFHDPLVVTSRGGPKGGGAELTPTGQMVLHHFRALEDILAQEGAQDLSSLSALLRPAQI